MNLDFNIVLEALISGGILIMLLCIVIIKINTASLISKGKSNIHNLHNRLQVAKQENQLLTQKSVLVENLSPVLFTRFFDIIKQILSLQKFIFEESQ